MWRWSIPKAALPDERVAAFFAAEFEQSPCRDDLDVAIAAEVVANPHLAFAAEGSVAKHWRCIAVTADHGKERDPLSELDRGHFDIVGFVAAKVAVS